MNDAPRSIALEQATAEGMEFGFSALALPREEFERSIAHRLTVMAELLGQKERGDEQIAAFDRAAWDAWEIGRG